MNTHEKQELTPRQREILFEIMTSEDRVYCIGRRIGLQTLRDLIRFEQRQRQEAKPS